MQTVFLRHWFPDLVGQLLTVTLEFPACPCQQPKTTQTNAPQRRSSEHPCIGSLCYPEPFSSQCHGCLTTAASCLLTRGVISLPTLQKLALTVGRLKEQRKVWWRIPTFSYSITMEPLEKWKQKQQTVYVCTYTHIHSVCVHLCAHTHILMSLHTVGKISFLFHTFVRKGESLKR